MNRRALTIAVAGLVVTAMAVYGGGEVLRVRALQAQIGALERDISGLRDRTRKLTETVECLRNDPTCIEKLAREEQGLARPDETILKFPSTRGK
ncbi:MAG: septum formation initiator family protein [Candidatus Rokubacteria bacterium]|nr:septum formation initiator family protein [Candidatus Rokubacteria bacterium]